MTHIPGHGISFADWFRNNQIQIGQSGGPAVAPNYSGMRMGGSSEAGMMNPDLWNMNIPNPMLNFGQIHSDARAGLGYVGDRYFDRNRPITVNAGNRPVTIPSPSIQGGQIGSDLSNLFSVFTTPRPDSTVGTGGNPALQWLQTGQPFAPSETSMVVPPPRAHDAPPQDSNRMADFLTALNTAMGQSAGYTPPAPLPSVSVGGQPIIGGNRLDQEGLADSMKRVRDATMVPPPNPSDLGVPPSVRDPMQWLGAGQPYLNPLQGMAPPPSAHDRGILPVSTEELMQRSFDVGGRGGLPPETIMASGGGPRVTDRYNRRIQNQMSSPLPLLALSQMMQRRSGN